MSEGFIIFTIFWNIGIFSWLIFLSMHFSSWPTIRDGIQREADWIMKDHIKDIHKVEKRCEYVPIEPLEAK